MAISSFAATSRLPSKARSGFTVPWESAGSAETLAPAGGIVRTAVPVDMYWVGTVKKTPPVKPTVATRTGTAMYQRRMSTIKVCQKSTE